MKFNNLKKKHFQFSKINKCSRNHLSKLKKNNFCFKITCFKNFSESQQKNLNLFISQFLKKQSNNQTIKHWFFFNFSKTITKLPLESRMGKGKGSIINNFGFFGPGFTLFEIYGINISLATSLVNLIKLKKKITLKVIYNYCY